MGDNIKAIKSCDFPIKKEVVDPKYSIKFGDWRALSVSGMVQQYSQMVHISPLVVRYRGIMTMENYTVWMVQHSSR